MVKRAAIASNLQGSATGFDKVDEGRRRPSSALVSLRLASVVVAMLPTIMIAASLQCALGTTRCVKSQGTEIPSSQALEILAWCADFTNDDLGRRALRMSYMEINDHSGGRLTPLVKAWHAFGDLHESPLAFERKRNAEDTNYVAIKRSCQQLQRDFNNDSRWTN